MKRKMRNRKGFTLAETLVVLALLAIMTVAGMAGISAVMASRNGMIQTADAEVLGSTALQSIANELRFGRNIKILDGGSKVSMVSTTYGTATVISVDDEGKLKFNDTPDGQFMTEHAYTGLKITDVTFTSNDDGAVASINISVTVSGDKGELWTGGFDVVPLNSKVATEPVEP